MIYVGLNVLIPEIAYNEIQDLEITRMARIICRIFWRQNDFITRALQPDRTRDNRVIVTEFEDYICDTIIGFLIKRYQGTFKDTRAVLHTVLTRLRSEAIRPNRLWRELCFINDVHFL